MYQYHTLNNGLRIVFKRNESPVLHSGVYINIGSRDERAEEEGMAHFIEHCIFKGTEHRRARHILNRIDGVGGELNAFTTKEETCVYASALAEHLERCLELYADILFHSTFPEEEIEKEKHVVLEEINSYRDTPSEQIYDDFEERIYQGHPMAHNILGSKRNVRHFSTTALRAFMQRNYTTDRMVISVVGKTDFDRLVRMCEKYFGHYPRRMSAADRSVAPVPQHFSENLHRHTHQMHLMLGGVAPSVYDTQRVAFSLLNNIVGGPAMNSRLNVAIRERYGFCYTIETQYTPFSDSGLFYLYAGIDGEAYKRCSELLHKELLRLCEVRLTPIQLRSAQRQYVGQLAVMGESALNEMQAIGKSYLSYDTVEDEAELQQKILAVSADELRDVACRYLMPGELSLLIYD